MSDRATPPWPISDACASRNGSPLATSRQARQNRQRGLLAHQIAPHLGTKLLRKLRPLDIEAWHGALRDSVSARTMGHAHRLLSKALRDAVKNDLASRNVCREQAAPKIENVEQVIV